MGLVTITNSRNFSAPRDALWAIMREPGNMPAWNPKCHACTNVDGGGVGSRFQVEFEKAGKRKVAEGQIVGLSHGREIRLRYTYGDGANMGTVDETYTLSDRRRGGTRLVHVVDFRQSTLPCFVKLLICVIGKIGKSVGPDPLAGIDDLLAPAGEGDAKRGGDGAGGAT